MRPAKRRPALSQILGSAPAMDAYRKWAALPETATYIGLVADLVSPGPSDPSSRAAHSEAVAHLVRLETVDDFVSTCFGLEDYSDISGGGGMPPATYGAEVPPAVKKSRKKAEPAQAQ